MIYYPEMGETKPSSAIVSTRHVINSTYSAGWSIASDAAVRELFRALKIRPRQIRQIETIHGGMKWRALITSDAASKLARHSMAAHEMLLD